MIAGQITLTMLLPKPIKPIACGKHRKKQKLLILEDSIVRDKRASISHTYHDDSSSKCNLYCDVSTMVDKTADKHGIGDVCMRTFEELRKRAVDCMIWRKRVVAVR